MYVFLYFVLFVFILRLCWFYIDMEYQLSKQGARGQSVNCFVIQMFNFIT